MEPTLWLLVSGLIERIRKRQVRRFGLLWGASEFNCKTFTLTINAAGVLSFYNTPDVNQKGAFLDNVKVESVPSTVPIPGAMWLLGSGLIGLIGIGRRFKK